MFLRKQLVSTKVTKLNQSANRFHETINILSTNFQDWGRVELHEIALLLKEKWQIDHTLSPLWGLITWKQICVSLNHCIKKAEPSRLIPRKLLANLELVVASYKV